MENTFIMLKPDAVQRQLIGEIIGRLERKGLKLVALKMLLVDSELAQRHYEEHRDKPFFKDLVDFITSGPVVAMIWQGQNAIQVVRKMMGSTDPQKAELGTIRGDFALFAGNNIIHGSDSPESAAREIEIFFDPAEIVFYSKNIEKWIYGNSLVE